MERAPFRHLLHHLRLHQYGAQSLRVDAALAGFSTLEYCTLDLRQVRDESGVLEQHKPWLKEHIAELHARGALWLVA